MRRSRRRRERRPPRRSGAQVRRLFLAACLAAMALVLLSAALSLAREGRWSGVAVVGGGILAMVAGLVITYRQA